MLELQGHLRALLRQCALLEGVRELRLLPNANQKLRLRAQRQGIESALNAARSQRRKIHVGRDVLLARSFIRRCTRYVLPIGHDGVAMPAGELLLARVTVVNQHHKPSPIAEYVRDAIHPYQRRKRRLDPFPFFRMNAVAIQELVLGCRRRYEALDEPPVFEADPQSTAIVHHLDRKRVEEFVAEDDDVLTSARRRRLDRLQNLRLPHRDVFRQPFVQASSQMGRLLNQRTVQRTGEFGKLFRRPVQHIARKQPASRTKFDYINSLGRIERAPHLFELPRQQSPENGMNIARSVEVAGLAELLSRLRVVAELWLVQTQFHVAGKWNRPIASNLLRDAFA